MAYRISFIHAPDPFYSAYQNFGNKYMPVWAMSLAAQLPDDGTTSVDLFDTRIASVSTIPEADLFLFTGINQDIDHLRAVHGELKARYPSARFVIGGPICWSFEQSGELNRLDFFDQIAIGDGELLIGDVLENARSGAPAAKVLRCKERFDLGSARPVTGPLVEKYVRQYYGAVVEVSRGCPFLCEFCDIRIQPDNNRAHNKAAAVVVEEIDYLCRLGVSVFMLACDNFIGEPLWAHQLVDQLVAWREKTGFRPSFFTWLTLNLHQDEALMVKMRKAGFDMLFIGVESFDLNSLLETAKVQNRAHEDLPGILRKIQAYGFVITPGIIFGFDSDTTRLYDLTIDGMERSCLLTCNPSLLVALPGTPLFRRMSLSGRLRDGNQHIGRFKFQTNIRYILPKETLTRGYIDFVHKVSDGVHQYRRFAAYCDNLEDGRYIPLQGGGYGNLFEYVRSMLSNPVAAWCFVRRIGCFVVRPLNVWYALKGLALVARRRDRLQGGIRIFLIWMYGWTNFVMQNFGIKPGDFDIQSVEGPITRETILPSAYTQGVHEDIPVGKTQAQLRATTSQLERLVGRA
jgi:radical SAM superfamily enzyme YgiQ (UPF0313 family)